MMSINRQLFESERIRLVEIDHEQDAEMEAKWSHDAEYMRNIRTEPPRPLSLALVKKKYEDLDKEHNERANFFLFSVRSREDDRVVGFARIFWVEWTHGNGWLRLGIGEEKDRGKGLGREILDLLLRFSFQELNLYRLSAGVQENNVKAIRLLDRAGFVREITRRQDLLWDGKYWDQHLYGLMRREWEDQQENLGKAEVEK
jgi:RimJ/RimL family protein N-acetyltransferase